MTETRTTRLHVQRSRRGVRVDLTAGALTPRVISSGESSARVVFVATTALLLGGDDVQIDIRVGAGATLDLSDIAATVAYDGRGAACRWRADIVVESGAQLRWHSEPFVVAADADCTRELHADVAVGGRLLLRDTLVLGRHAEVGGSLWARTHLLFGTSPALIEDLDLRCQRERGLPGILGPHRVLDQLTTLGWRAPQLSDETLRLDAEAPATLLRHLGAHAHSSPLAAQYARCLRAMND